MILPDIVNKISREYGFSFNCTQGTYTADTSYVSPDGFINQSQLKLSTRMIKEKEYIDFEYYSKCPGKFVYNVPCSSLMEVCGRLEFLGHKKLKAPLILDYF